MTALQGVVVTAPHTDIPETVAVTETTPLEKQDTIFPVPFFSQFVDISSQTWKGRGCGIASLAMLIEYYKPGSVNVDTLLSQGISAGAYLDNAGWKHYDLAHLANRYGLSGMNYDLSGSSMDTAYEALKNAVAAGPVIASVHYTFDPANPIPHLVVIDGIDGNTIYYNDPAESAGHGTVSKTKFLSSWKKRYIEVRPV